jgi:hypothetical protein
LTLFLNQYWLFFSQHPLWVILSLLSAVLFTIYIYRKTNPVISKSKKVLLIALRALALTFCLLVLFQATLGHRYKKFHPPQLAVLTDVSASMNVEDARGNRPKIVKSVLHQLTGMFPDYGFKWYRFSSHPQAFSAPGIDSLMFVGDATDISLAIRQVQEQLQSENLSAMLVISDGNYNKGGNPVRSAEKSTVPIYSVGIGSDKEVPDLKINDLSTSAFAYTKESTPVKIKIQNNGFSRTQTTVRLMKDDSVYARQTVQLPPSPSEKTITLDYIPQTPGQHKLIVDIGRKSDEKMLENNRQTVYIDVLKAKLTILILAGRVTPEISFLRRHLSQNKRYQIFAEVQKDQNAFFHIAPKSDILSRLQEVDIFILVDFPGRHTSDALLQKLIKSLKQNQQSILLFTDQSVDMRKLEELEPFIPVLANSMPAQTEKVYPLLSVQGKQHPITAFDEQIPPGSLIWDQLPPVYMNLKNITLWPNSTVLLYGVRDILKKQNTAKSPLFVIRKSTTNKSAALLADGIWQWDLMVKGMDPQNRIYHHFINHTIRWLETKQSDNLVQIKANSRYRFGEKALIEVQAFDQKLEPVDSADILLRLQHPLYKKEYIPTAVETGIYRAEISPQYPGDYTIRARASLHNRDLGNTEFRFTVGEYSKELSVTRQARITLKSLALNSGGQYIEPDSLNRLSLLIQGNVKNEIIKKEQSLWNQPIILFLIIFLLALEWFIRKRAGMV